MKKTIIRAANWSIVGSTLFLSGCQQARVDRWVEVPCQPHGFYVAPKGQTLDEVARVCRVDQSLLHRHNAWLITQQPFKENTVVWLKRNPLLGAEEDDDLQLGTVNTSIRHSLSAEQLMPLNLSNRESKRQ